MTTTLLHPHPVEPDSAQAPTPASSRRPAWLAAVGLLVVSVGAGSWWVAGTPVDSSPELDVAGYAELAVSRSLIGSGGEWYVVDATTIATRADEDAVVATVAIHLLGSTEQGFADLGERFFEIRLAPTDTGWVADGHPGAIPPPVAGAVLPGPPSSTDLALAAAVHEYLAWLLTGAPGPFAEARPEPAPYERIEITGLETPPSEGGVIRVDLSAADAAGRGMELTYHLGASIHRGRWIVGR